MDNIHYLTVKDPPPMKHQQDCFYKLYPHDFCAIFGEQGTGKSRMCIDIVSNKFAEGVIDFVLLIAPKGPHGQWHDEQVPYHSPVATERFIWESKSTKGYMTALKKFIETPTPGRLKWLFINVDTFSSDRHIPTIRGFLKMHNAAIVVDESTRIKNPTANRTFNILYNLGAQKRQGRKIEKLLPYSKFRTILTGMQVTNSPYDLWAPFNFLKFDFFETNYYGFKAKYGIEVQDKNEQTNQKYSRKISPTEIQSTLKYFKSGYSSEQIGNILGISVANIDYIVSHPNIKFPYKHLDALKALIEPYSFTIRKEDCLDLKPKVPVVSYIDMQPEQARVYKDLKNKMLAEYGDQELAVTSKLALITRLQQVTSGFFPYQTKEFDEETSLWKLNQEIISIGKKNPKIEMAKQQIEELGDNSVFIACRFVPEIQMAERELQKAFPDKVVKAYYGKISDMERKKIETGFKAGEVDILLMNIRMAIGFNFQEVCSNGFALSGTYSLEDRKQWEDRLHRIGQKLSVVYRDFIIRGTVDEKIYNAIKFKESLLDYFRDHSLTEFLT